MIVGKLVDLYRYKGIAHNIDTAIDYLLSHDLMALPKGKTIVEFKDVLKEYGEGDGKLLSYIYA